jgi:hypothetical protein
VPEVFSPYGTMPAFKTATSYFSFVQIAPVAGKIKKLGRDPPRSLIGGVLLVALHRLRTFVSTSLMGGDQFAALGETGVVNIGRSIAGPFGAAALLGSGLPATLSSQRVHPQRLLKRHERNTCAFAFLRTGLNPSHRRTASDIQNVFPMTTFFPAPASASCSRSTTGRAVRGRLWPLRLHRPERQSAVLPSR